MAVLVKQPARCDPGMVPRWGRSYEGGVGTAYNPQVRTGYRSNGIPTEACYPMDRPQIRDLQYLITDGQTTDIWSRTRDAATSIGKRQKSIVKLLHQHSTEK